MNQLELFGKQVQGPAKPPAKKVRYLDDPARSRASDPATSHAAADAAAGLAERQKRDTLAVLDRHQGLTSRELAETEAARSYGLDRYALARRLSELRDRDGRVRNGPPRRCGQSGRQALTWWVV